VKHGTLTLILGGARSGKSRHALTYARPRDRVLFVATAEGGDAEMEARIAAHRLERPAGWQTLEAPRDVAAAIGSTVDDHAVVIVDCLTLLASNVVCALSEEAVVADVERALQAEVEALLDLRGQRRARWVIVSNEVGMGVVPAYASGRMFRDALGRANQQVALAADEVVLMVAGLPWSLTRSRSV
jgi:adenosylcobinamide kinase / adenosylcobinamide-phosphate guanylyltransferase